MPLTLYQRGKFWHYRGTIAGRQLRGSTGATEKKIAERIKAQIEADAWRSHLDGPRAHVTMAQAAIAYRDAGKPTRFLEVIEDHWKDTRIATITAESIRKSAQKLYPSAKTATWNRQVIAPTQAIINYAADLGWCGHLKVKRFSVVPRKKIPATEAWVNTFVSQAREDGLPELAALCLFMFGTGARISEALNMLWGDIDLPRRMATLRGDKPKPWEREAHMPVPVLTAISNLPSNRDPDGTVFGYAARDSLNKTWPNVTTRAGIEPLTPHCCRHGFATTLLRKGIDVKTVAERGGWKDAATVLKSYAHALEDKTVTEVLFGTDMAQSAQADNLTTSNKRTKTK